MEHAGEHFAIVHARPITGVFIPYELQCIPKLPNELDGLRITIYQRTGTTETHEAQRDFTGPVSRLELGTPWTCETIFKLHPSQTRGRYCGGHTNDESPL